MCCLLSGTFVLVTVAFIGNLTENFVLVKYSLRVSLPGGIFAQAEAADSQPLFQIWEQIINWSGNIEQFIADLIIAWRAWALWPNNKTVQWTLISLVLADIGVTIADSVVDTRKELSGANQSVTLDWVISVLSLLVNVVATSLIAYRAWMYHNSINFVSIRRRKTQMESILLIIVESGGFFGIMQVLTIIFEKLDVNAVAFSPLDLGTRFIINLYSYVAALNPVVIFILVQTQNTYEQSMHLDNIPSSIQAGSHPQHVDDGHSAEDSLAQDVTSQSAENQECTVVQEIEE
ncbi:hypothetical protein BT96DRAFT_1025046 [Gymnopus androsaceus JB14]|uniref:Uncharacterized protein n=1 Tax=Gymnopus androsaceus JB14 TaxID=1447944 RepID=A0A6A4GVC8_9AGAR|nr:hypothetical protein BT96DRAFT_1025046 [Gymnopus androsaceus JB14]